MQIKKTKKSFGQNLLVDKIFLEKIISACNLKSDDTVIEIGSGSGLLTVPLAKQVKKVFAVEVERNILKKLKYNINQLTNIEIVESSFLKIDLARLSDVPFKIIGNIPYNLTSKILIKLFGELDAPASHLKYLKDIFLMVQLEVAKRLVAQPDTKAYSPLTILIQYFSNPAILFKVPQTAFMPAPKIESAFVHLKVKPNLQNINNPVLLKKVIKTAFQQRRKKIINSLKKLYSDKELTAQRLNELNLDHNLRAENLNFEDFLRISDSL